MQSFQPLSFLEAMENPRRCPGKHSFRWKLNLRPSSTSMLAGHLESTCKLHTFFPLLYLSVCLLLFISHDCSFFPTRALWEKADAETQECISNVPLTGFLSNERLAFCSSYWLQSFCSGRGTLWLWHYHSYFLCSSAITANSDSDILMKLGTQSGDKSHWFHPA